MAFHALQLYSLLAPPVNVKRTQTPLVGGQSSESVSHAGWAGRWANGVTAGPVPLRRWSTSPPGHAHTSISQRRREVRKQTYPILSAALSDLQREREERGLRPLTDLSSAQSQCRLTCCNTTSNTNNNRNNIKIKKYLLGIYLPF